MLLCLWRHRAERITKRIWSPRPTPYLSILRTFRSLARWRARRANFSSTRKFRRRENFGKKSLGRCDRFRQKIVEIGAILAIFRPFEDFARSRRSSRNKWSADLEELWIFERYHEIRLEKSPQMSKKSALYDFWLRGKKIDFDFFLDF